MSKKTKSGVPFMIVATFISFAAFIGYMVYQSFQQDVNLVQRDYYQVSTAHDMHMKSLERANKVGVKLFYDKGDDKVYFQIPSSFNPVEIKGNVWFYRPSDAKKDFVLPINVKNDNNMVMSMNTIDKGKWEVKTSFKYKGEDYFRKMIFSK